MSTSTPQRRTLVAVLILVAAVVAASLAWVVASPVGSSPDEDFHVGSMWCPPPVDKTGCQISTKDGEKAVMVPQSLAKEYVTCYAFDHDNSALCALNASDEELAPTLRWDDGNYPWGYYQFAHLFVQRSTSHAVLALRTVNTLLAIGLIGAIIALADSGLKRAISVGVTVAWLPMGVYFVAGMNPSSWAMTGTFAFAAGLLAATRSAGPRRVGLIACALAGAVLACTSRGDSAFFLFVVTVALAFAVPLSRRIIPEATLACVASVVGIWVMARTNVAASHLGSGNELAEYSLKHIAWLNVSSLPNYLRGFVGHLLGPGWNDVSYQGTVSYGASVVVIAVLCWSLRSLSWRKALSAITVAGAITGVPVVIGLRGHFNNVLTYQPRYMLPLFAVFLLMLLAPSPHVRTMRGGAWAARNSDSPPASLGAWARGSWRRHGRSLTPGLSTSSSSATRSGVHSTATPSTCRRGTSARGTSGGGQRLRSDRWPYGSLALSLARLRLAWPFSCGNAPPKRRPSLVDRHFTPKPFTNPPNSAMLEHVAPKWLP